MCGDNQEPTEQVWEVDSRSLPQSTDGPRHYKEMLQHFFPRICRPYPSLMRRIGQGRVIHFSYVTNELKDNRSLVIVDMG